MYVCTSVLGEPSYSTRTNNEKEIERTDGGGTDVCFFFYFSPCMVGWVTELAGLKLEGKWKKERLAKLMLAADVAATVRKLDV